MSRVIRETQGCFPSTWKLGSLTIGTQCRTIPTIQIILRAPRKKATLYYWAKIFSFWGEASHYGSGANLLLRLWAHKEILGTKIHIILLRSCEKMFLSLLYSKGTKQYQEWCHLISKLGDHISLSISITAYKYSLVARERTLFVPISLRVELSNPSFLTFNDMVTRDDAITLDSTRKEFLRVYLSPDAVITRLPHRLWSMVKWKSGTGQHQKSILKFLLLSLSV